LIECAKEKKKEFLERLGRARFKEGGFYPWWQHTQAVIT